MRIRSRIQKLFAMNAASGNNNTNQVDLEVIREEYANAFRTESYIEFWTKVLAISQGDSATCNKIVGSTSATRLLSYRLFVDHLLDPDQDSVTRLLESIRIRAHKRSLLASYFEVTAEASLLCSLLLKDVDSMRRKYKSLKKSFDSQEIINRLSDFTSSPPSISPSHQFRAVQDKCSDLLKRLELSRDRALSKLGLAKKIKVGSVVFLGVLTVVLVAHAIAIVVVATPCIMSLPIVEFVSTTKLAKWSAQLDVAAKGAYILTKDLDTISRLVARLNDELEDMHTTVNFWLDKSKDHHQLQARGQIALQLNNNKCDVSFIEKLDELEEHLYLCFLTINRARNLVIKEISQMGQSRHLSTKNMLPRQQ